MPAGIDTPGFVEEEKEKPAVTRKIEESDEQISAEKCAEFLIAGESFLRYLSPFLVLVPLPSACASPPSFPYHLPSSLSRRRFFRQLCADHRRREGLLSIYLAPHRGVDQGGFKGFSTGK
jgi:hypothetical protein